MEKIFTKDIFSWSGVFMFKNKKGIYYLLIGVLITVLLFSSIVAVVAFAVGRRYRTDDELFNSAKDNSATVYYAVDTLGTPYEIWTDISGGSDEWCSIDDASEYLKLGFLAAEDREYYKHHGINLKRTSLALLNQVFHFKPAFGASTITQQVIKNISGDNERNLRRKSLEIFRAMRLEGVHSKDEIFELYLNIVPMSHNVYGVAGASELYFGKEPSDLTLAEAATIVGVTNSPARYNPLAHPKASKEKRNKVLYAMYSCGFIDEVEYSEAIEEPLSVTGVPANRLFIGSWFIETAREDILRDLMEKHSVTYQGAKMLLHGASVTLTVDEEIQKILEDCFSNSENLSSSCELGLNYSMAVTDNRTGDLVGVIGRAGKKEGNYLLNLATAPITPASALKPIALYAPLIDSGTVSPSTLFPDLPLYYKETEGRISAYPKNSPDIYDGDITLADALHRSKNTVAIQLYEMLGKEKIYDILKVNYGFENLSERDKNISPLALGQLTGGVSIRKLTEAYGVFPTGGIKKSARSYITVFSKGGKLLLENEQSEKRIMRSDTAMIMTGLLSGVIQRGTASRITLGEIVDTAGKTGTSGGDLDRIFVGFTPYYTAGIWCGYADGSTSIGKNTPSHLEIWDGVMKKIHEGVALKGDDDIKSFTYPGLYEVKISSVTGERYCELCDDEPITAYFRFSDMPPEHKCENYENKNQAAAR